MKLRAPAYPLITVDPYFSVWSMADQLNTDVTKHWTGTPQPITATAEIDGFEYLWMGDAKSHAAIAMEQFSVDFDALSTTYIFLGGGVELTAIFTSPLLPQDLMLLSRPITYLNVSVKSIDGNSHQVNITIDVSEEICLNHKGEMPIETSIVTIPDNIGCAKMGSVDQPILKEKGDDIRINWGYFYLAVQNSEVHSNSNKNGLSAVISLMTDNGRNGSLILFAYDDLYSLEYFGNRLKAYWKKDEIHIEELIAAAVKEYDSVKARCDEFSQQLVCDAELSGGEHYAEILALSYRQVIAAHKLVLDEKGQLLFISKECFSNGCAATVDVSYPSIPMFLIYNPELIKGMMRPIFRYVTDGVWPFDFAPHDAGCYPIVNGQVYSNGIDAEHQMPIEECGNMLIMATALSLAQKDVSFALEYLPLLQKWADYLLTHGIDPDNQLCTDDFAGHMAHNCNLSLKAILAIAGFGVIARMSGDEFSESTYMVKAKEMATKWVEMAANKDGGYRLAFDKPESYSMKYNIIWDKLFGTELFPAEVLSLEYDSYKNKINKYGLPLDNRADYTKSDWLLWTATICENKDDFMLHVDTLWNAFNESESRVPMTDWFDTNTAKQVGFQHRSVQGGLFIKLLDSLKICKYE